MVTGFRASTTQSGAYYYCDIASSSSTSGALVCTGVGNYGDTQGFSSSGANSASATAPNWHGQKDLVVAAYAGRFYYPYQTHGWNLESSTWNIACSPTIWVNMNSANYTYYDSWYGTYHLNFDWMTIATSASPGTSISCSVSLTITTTGQGSLTYYPPGSFSIQFFGA